MYGQHPLRVSEDPLLVRVGGVIISGGVVGRSVQEQLLVLGRAVLGSVGSRVPFEYFVSKCEYKHVIIYSTTEQKLT